MSFEKKVIIVTVRRAASARNIAAGWPRSAQR